MFAALRLHWELQVTWIYLTWTKTKEIPPLNFSINLVLDFGLLGFWLIKVYYFYCHDVILISFKETFWLTWWNLVQFILVCSSSFLGLARLMNGLKWNLVRMWVTKSIYQTDLQLCIGIVVRFRRYFGAW